MGVSVVACRLAIGVCDGAADGLQQSQSATDIIWVEAMRDADRRIRLSGCCQRETIGNRRDGKDTRRGKSLVVVGGIVTRLLVQRDDRPGVIDAGNGGCRWLVRFCLGQMFMTIEGGIWTYR